MTDNEAQADTVLKIFHFVARITIFVRAVTLSTLTVARIARLSGLHVRPSMNVMTTFHHHFSRTLLVSYHDRRRNALHLRRAFLGR